MKETISCLLICVTALFGEAQADPSWNVRHNNKMLLRSSEEDAVKNTIPIRLSDFNEKGSFIITYTNTRTGNEAKKWVRTIALFTEADSVLYSKKSCSLKVADTDLKKMLQQNRIIKVYTWAVPKDPAQAARVRIRRVHLCTFELNQ